MIKCFACSFPVLPDQFEVALGASDVCGKLVWSAAATWPVALWPGTAGIIQLVDLRRVEEKQKRELLISICKPAFIQEGAELRLRYSAHTAAAVGSFYCV